MYRLPFRRNSTQSSGAPNSWRVKSVRMLLSDPSNSSSWSCGKQLLKQKQLTSSKNSSQNRPSHAPLTANQGLHKICISSGEKFRVFLKKSMPILIRVTAKPSLLGKLLPLSSHSNAVQRVWCAEDRNMILWFPIIPTTAERRYLLGNEGWRDPAN